MLSHSHVGPHVFLKVMDTVVFDPSLLPVDPAEGMANLTFGFSERDNPTRLMGSSVPVIIETTFNILEEVRICIYRIGRATGNSTIA